jgi:hypothetical protein
MVRVAGLAAGSAGADDRGSAVVQAPGDEWQVRLL